ncbi:MAG TPA: MFS transporter [Acidimicrobiales bacterium]|nr:MFS transporter [Acidimicrobiales bacterium]
MAVTLPDRAGAKLVADPNRPPLDASYATKVALVLVALCPFIVVTTATTLLGPVLVVDLHTTKLALQIANGMANAGYAFGAVLAVAFLKRRAPRRLFMAYEGGFVLGCVLSAISSNVGVYGAGRVLQGFFTGLLLVAALPPLVTKFPVAKLSVTAAVVDVGLFGATTLGPLVGGIAASHHAWRTVFWILGGIGVLALLIAYLSVEEGRPLDPSGRLDKSAVVLAAAGTFLPFFAAAELTAEPPTSPLVYGTLIVGVGSLVTLLVVEYRRPDPLTPVRLLAHTFPIIGIVAAMVTGAAAVALLELVQTFLVQSQHVDVLRAGLTLWPQVLGVAVASVVFGAMFRRRGLPLLVLAGAAVLGAAAIAMATVGLPAGQVVILLVAAAIGLGAGTTVSPGLFLAALSCPSSELGPAFALVELLRSEAAFLFAPIVLRISLSHGMSPSAVNHGVSDGGLVTAIMLGIGAVICVALWVTGGARFQRPDLHGWLDDGREALRSPAVAARYR